MGASGWNYVEPWAGGVEETFEALRAREFAGLFGELPEDLRPADIAELWSGDEFDEDTWLGFMCAQGTHTIVDIRSFVGADVDLDALPEGSTMRQVPAAEVLEVFGHGRPGRDEFERLTRHSPLFGDDGRGTGRCAVLYEGRDPVAVAFWGRSGD
jgi:hypothetical protein